MKNTEFDVGVVVHVVCCLVITVYLMYEIFA